MITRKKVTKVVVTKTCDWCSLHDGDHIADEHGTAHVVVRKARYWAKFYSKGWNVRPRPCKCNHDICSDCWHYPGDLVRCPKCNPDLEKARKYDDKKGYI